MEERGQYITILCVMHQKGRLSSKTIGLCVGNAAADVMAKLRQDSAGLWYSERLEIEIDKRKKHAQKQRERALEGWKKRKKEDNQESDISHGNATAMPLENENVIVIENRNKEKKENEIEIIIYPSFDDFWNLYDKKIDKPKCELKWKKLKQSEKEAIMQYIPDYIASQPDKKFRKNPETFLNNKAWENEIIKPEKNGKQITASGTLERLKSYTND
jgi:hypothetical protein